MRPLREDQFLIRNLIENCSIWLDSCDWERFRTRWYDDVKMMATWFQGPPDGFVKMKKQGFEKNRSDVVIPTKIPVLCVNILACFSDGYRHLERLQAGNECPIKTDRYGSTVGRPIN